ncbi:MAG: hypothetical protein WC497_06075 [Patescibacteria group bacterium]
MFGRGKKKAAPVAEPETTPAVMAPPVKTEGIRTMPEKFLDNKIAQPGKKKNWLVIIIILGVLALLILAAIVLLSRIIKPTNQNTNVNQNTNQNANVNTNINANANANTNTVVKIEELGDVVLTKQELGHDFIAYTESEVEVDEALIAELNVMRARAFFALEQADQQISVEQTVYEAASQKDAETIYALDKTNRDKQVEKKEGEYQPIAIGESSYLYISDNIDVIDLTFTWKYLKVTTKIQIAKGTLAKWDVIKDWSEQVLEKMKQYDKDRPPVNKNTNTNTNSNSNANTNTNVNTNSNANSNVNIEPPTRSRDTDGDGLTDREELLFKTNIEKPDTDGDNFSDGAEVVKEYDPTAAGGAKLEDSSLVRSWENPVYSYSILYPATWTRQKTTADESSAVFMSPDTGEFFQVLVESNTKRLSPKQWYLDKAGVNPDDVEEVIINGLMGVQSPDGLNYYLGKTNVIYVLNYNLAEQVEANFMTTFAMFANSFTLTGEAVAPAEESCPTCGNANANENANQNTNTNKNSNIVAPVNIETPFPE